MRSTRGLAVIRGSLLLMASGIAFAVNGSTNDAKSGPYSAFTRHQLRTNWPRADKYPVLVPKRLPAGAATAPEVGFYLSNVVTDSSIAPGKRSWVSYYDSDVLGGKGSSFRVFQRHAKGAERGCGPMGNVRSVVRKVGHSRITICSKDLATRSEARHFWKTVALTHNYAKVSWLRG